MQGAIALIRSDRRDGETVVAVRGEIDVGTCSALREWLSRASDGGRRPVCLDLRRVRFLAVSGLYVLGDEQQRMARHRARLTIVCSEERILQLFSVCGLDDALRVAAVPGGPAADEPWNDEDDARAARLAEWLRRYTTDPASASA